ncbi:MAG TPA: DNA replication and repair protein RecF [Eggerthellaceae bacterium]|nr:DNA replication and repair protein RecF [Eggerthellaceae bacterium]
MGLNIRSLDLLDFRNYEHFALEDIGRVTVLVGRNAIGKTNVLEAVNLITATSALRHKQLSELIREGAAAARVQTRLEDGNRDLTCTLYVEPGKKRYELNGKAKPSSDMRGILPAVSFTPDDLELVKKSASVKRKAIDDMGMQLSANYHVIRNDYEKALRYKNRLLKEEASQDLVEAVGETLVRCGAQLFCYRHSLFKRLVPLVQERYGELSQSGEDFAAQYLPSWLRMDGIERDELREYSRDEVRLLMEQSLAYKAGEERARRRCLIGPHNDDISFFVAGRNASLYASQGQQRSVVLAWKLAEVDMVKSMLQTAPVLLLDDVLSELDGSRREMLLSNVKGDMQTFITATDLAPFDNDVLGDARIVNLEEGRRHA